MYINRAVYLSFFLSAAVAISLLTAFVDLTTAAMASGKGGGGGGAVAQVKVNSGNSNLDKEVNKFYNCISKTHQDPPTLDQIYNCYYQALGGSGSSSTSNYGLTGTATGTTSSSSSTTSTGSAGHHHKHGTSTTITTTTTSSNDVITGTAIPVLPTSLTFNSYEGHK